MPLLEKHYSIPEIAAALQLDPNTIRKIFRDTPGVVKVAHPSKRRKRPYVTLRIPQSVLERRLAELRAAK